MTLLAHPGKNWMTFFLTSHWHRTGCLPGWRAATAFSGNTVNVYTGTDRAGTGPSLKALGRHGPGFLGTSERVLWAQGALWRRKQEVRGSGGPASAASEFSLNPRTLPEWREPRRRSPHLDSPPGVLVRPEAPFPGSTGSAYHLPASSFTANQCLLFPGSLPFWVPFVLLCQGWSQFTQH